jgi:uncharacterized SAM-binding protein YcdF (DUF218 family)
MTDEELSPEQIAAITAYVDVEAPPPDTPTAVFIFGTNQPTPVRLAADRYHRGHTPLIIATGGINRHNGIVEGREFSRLLREDGVPEDVIRCEDTSANTWQNVEFAMPHLREARDAGLTITVVCKWYHRRAVHVLRTVLPDSGGCYAVTFEPVYGDTAVTRSNWPNHPQGRRRVIREWQEVPRRVADGSFVAANLTSGMWQ